MGAKRDVKDAEKLCVQVRVASVDTNDGAKTLGEKGGSGNAGPRFEKIVGPTETKEASGQCGGA